MTTDTRVPLMARGAIRSAGFRQVIGLGLLLAVVLQGRSDAAPSDILNGYVHASWTTEHGLPTSAITAITQDQRGYLWLGSFAGLIRFDGERFVHWNAIGTPELPESLIHAVAVSRDGSIWVGFGNLGGVGRIQGDVLRVYTVRDGLPEGSIQSLVEDRDGGVWAAGPGGVARFREERWGRLGSPRSIGRLFLGRDGTLYGVTSAGVVRRDPSTDAFDVLGTSVGGADIAEDTSSAIWTTGQGYLLRQLQCSTAAPQTRQGSALQLACVGGRWRAAGPPPSAALAGRAQPTSPTQANRGFNGYRLLKDRHGHLWIATLGQGLVHIRSDAWATGSASARITRQQGLTNDRVLSLFEDRESNIWVGTSIGLNRFSERTGVDPLAHRPELEGHNVLTVSIAGDGAVWAGTANGVARFDANGSRWYSEREGLPGSSVRSLHVDARGTLWVATDGGPAKLSDGRFTRLLLPDTVRLNQVSAITTDLEGGVWLFDARGAYRWTAQSTTPVALSPGPEGRRVSAALTDSSTGRIWAGFAGGGVVVYDHGRIKSYSASDGLSGDTVTAIHEDTGGTIWVGTIHALSRFDGDRFSTVTHADGLPGNRLTSIHGDQDGNLWIGTDFGFARITPQEFDRAVSPPGPYRMSYRQIDASDGLEGIPTNRGYPNAARRADGTLWFVTSDGLTVVTPGAFRQAARPRPPLIERAYVDERPIAPSNVQLPARTARLQIDYTSVTLSAAPRVRFRYMLEGNDSDWVDAGSRRQAFYTNLRPGDYRFRVAARIGDDEWVESEHPWAFAIQPALYQTTWFSVASGLALVAAAWGAWRVRLRQVRRQHALVIAERTRLAREIHDTLLQAMAGVALQLHRASELLAAAPPAREICEKARDSLERYVRDARFAIWRLRSPELTESDLAGALRKVAEDLTAGSGAELTFKVVGAPARCAATVEDHVLRIGQEAILNAVRHAEAPNVCVELHYGPGHVKLRVVDDGCGFEPDRVTLRAHWGLAGMHERATLIGGRLTVTSAPAQGTVVEATIPLRLRAATTQSRLWRSPLASHPERHHAAPH